MLGRRARQARTKRAFSGVATVEKYTLDDRWPSASAPMRSSSGSARLQLATGMSRGWSMQRASAARRNSR
jgi:hypothetical protein